MRKVRFVYYIAKFDVINVLRRKRKLHLLDDGISLWTKLFNWLTPPYSHMSVWKPGMGKLSDNSWHGEWISDGSLPDRIIFYGTCYTSTMRGDENGTVSRPAAGVFKHPERWEYIEIEVTDESFELAQAWADERVRLNKGYSLRDIRRFFMPLWVLKKLKWDDPDREICSEHGEGWAMRLYLRNILFGEYLLHEVLIRSPRRLWRDLVRRHHVKTYSLATGKMVRDESGKKVKT